MVVRGMTVAGSFYPSEKREIEKLLGSFFKGLPKEGKSGCVVAPHAGWDYSGKTAACSFNALQEAGTFVVIGPSHTGLGEEISVSGAGQWETPLGRVGVDAGLREKLLEKLGIEADDVAHLGEHSLEVQLPFLQFKFKNFKILPITIMAHDLERLLSLGEALAELKGNFNVVASGDFTHHEPLESAREKDMRAIERIEAMDIGGFYKMVVEQRLTICGLAPITAAMQYCSKKGMKKGRLLKYDTSASGTGDESSVVGYAAIKFE